MKKFIITTDGNSDLTEDYAREHDIRLIPLYYNLDGKLYAMMSCHRKGFTQRCVKGKCRRPWP